MRSLQDDTGSHISTPLSIDSLRRVGSILQNRDVATIVSWLVWLLSVAIFALWTRGHYLAPAAPAWIGMTIHTTVFAIWMLVVREWMSWRLIRIRPQEQNLNKKPRDEV